VDASAPIARQKLTFDKVHARVHRDYAFASKDIAPDYFIKLTGLLKNFNYAAPDTPDYHRLLGEIDTLAAAAG
jgi:V/A-type H+-transporting ATPase subunit A